MTEHKFTNRLIHETSPYLLQHAHNPVDWYAWGEEALAAAREARQADLLSIGYSACHWCHVMEHESFEDEETAALMNELFVNIKVDREERPDLDAIYMDAVQSMTGQGGWPMSVWLTPDGKPFHGGTYYPKEPRYGMPGFQQVLRAMAEAYANRRDKVDGQADRLTAMLHRSATVAADGGELGIDILVEALVRMRQYFDDEDGGFGTQPKFPQPMTLDFALTPVRACRRPGRSLHGRTDAGKDGARRHLRPTRRRLSSLQRRRHLARAPLREDALRQRPAAAHLPARLAGDPAPALPPHCGGDHRLRAARDDRARRRLLQHAGRRQRRPRRQVFRLVAAEIEALLEPQTAAIFETYYGVSDRGNFEGENILSVVRSVENVAERFSR